MSFHQPRSAGKWMGKKEKKRKMRILSEDMLQCSMTSARRTLGGFIEQFATGAFDDSIASGAMMCAVFSITTLRLLLGRRSSGTLESGNR